VFSAQAQDATDEHRCTGQWHATIQERVASCTTLIDSGHYQPPNLAILNDNRGAAYRAAGDLTNARQDFDQAIALDPSDARAYADRGNLLLGQHRRF
jgi:lipoprotein NlpI